MSISTPLSRQELFENFRKWSSLMKDSQALQEESKSVFLRQQKVEEAMDQIAQELTSLNREMTPIFKELGKAQKRLNHLKAEGEKLVFKPKPIQSDAQKPSSGSDRKRSFSRRNSAPDLYQNNLGLVSEEPSSPFSIESVVEEQIVVAEILSSDKTQTFEDLSQGKKTKRG